MDNPELCQWGAIPFFSGPSLGPRGSGVPTVFLPA